MNATSARVLYVVLLAVVIIAMDVAFFKGRFWARLIANVVIALIFAALYYRFLRQS